MLNLNLDLDIQKYVTVDFGVIADAIDLLGGVEIEIKEEEIQYLNKFVQETADSAGKRGTPGRNCRTSVIRRSSGNDLCKNPVDSRW